MKKMNNIKYILALTTLLTPLIGKAQGINIDTIKINPNFTATLEFPSKLALPPIIGNNPFKVTQDGRKIYRNYKVQTVDNIVIIRALRVDIPLTNITVKTLDAVYHGILNFDKNPTQHYYSFYPAEPYEEKVNSEEMYEDGVELYKVKDNEVDEKTILKRMDLTEAKENDYTIVKQVGGVIFQVGQIVNDSKYNYIKLVAQNSSSSTYRVNGVLFRYEEGKAGLFNKKNTENIEWLDPEKVKFPTNKTIEAYTYENIVFAIPLYAGKDGNMIIKIIEENGTREATLKVKAETLNNTEVFD